MTKNNDGGATRGWIFYDAECGFCVGTRNRIGPVFEARGFQWRAIKSPIATEMLGLNLGEMPGEMKLRLANGSICGGVEAWAVLCRSVWWLWALGAMMELPILDRFARGGYRWIARNRYCLGGRCRLPESRSADFQIGLAGEMQLVSGSAPAPGAANRALAVGTERGQPCPRESMAGHRRTRLSALLSPTGMSARTRPSSARGRAEPQPGRPRSPILQLRRSLDWLPLLLLPSLVMTFYGEVAPWIFMWLLAFAIYAGCKWLTYEDATAAGVPAPFRACLTYLLLWPGMSFKEFVGTPETVSEPARWLAPAAKAIVGAALVWFAVPAIPADAELVRGWVGMIGLIMMLHFGTFHLLALTLQTAGFNARPNMNAPLLARSLADFWGRRWNTGFNVLADRYAFRPLTPRVGPRAALVIVFLASGLIHDLVIAFPAGGGYGLPTLYFAIQAGGMFLERAPLIRRRPWLNQLFTWLVLIAPLGCLFPSVFVRNVILPMLNAIGAN